VDETLSDATVTAIKKWQGDLGLPKTGTVELGRILYAPGQVRVDTLKAAEGDTAMPGALLYTYTGTSRVVTVELKVSDQRLVRTGAAVTVKLPNGKPVPGKTAKAKTIIKPAEGNNPASTKISVTVTVDDESTLADLDKASVDVGFTASQRE